MNNIESLVEAPKLLSWDPTRRCQSCGLGGMSLVDRWHLLLRNVLFRHVNLVYCPGGKPPTDSIELGLLMGQREVSFDCAGIQEPHLHVICRICGARWLMRRFEDEAD